MYLCPLCMKTEYMSLDSLCFELTKVTIKHIRCPVCDETVLGLDKYTIHLYSHLLQKEKLSKSRAQIETVTLNVLVKNMCKALDPQNSDVNVQPRSSHNQSHAMSNTANRSNCRNTDPPNLHPTPNICNLTINAGNRGVQSTNQASVINPLDSSSNVVLSIAPNLIPSVEKLNNIVTQNIPSQPLENSQSIAMDHTAQNSVSKEIPPKLYIVLPDTASSTKVNTTSEPPGSELMTIDNKDILWNLGPPNPQPINASPFEFEEFIKLKPNEHAEGNIKLDSGNTISVAPHCEKDLQKCNLCSFSFPDLGILKMHQQLVHKHNSLAKLNKRVYYCQYCNKGFKMKGSLLVHYRVAHKHLFPDLESENLKNTEGRESPDEAFKGNDYKCNICSKTFKKEQFLTQHYKTHESKQWECDVCAKSFTTKYFLRKHKRIHTGDQRYYCEPCNKAFTFQQSYHKHVLYHSDEKPYPCTTCGRAFKEMSTLHNHERIHTGEKPYACETCGKTFRQRISCLVHSRIHTGAMPYQCTACHKRFRYKGSEKSHKCPVSPPGQIVLCDTDKKPRNLLTSIKNKLSVGDKVSESSKVKLVPELTTKVEANDIAFSEPVQQYYYPVAPTIKEVTPPSQQDRIPMMGPPVQLKSLKREIDQSENRTQQSVPKTNFPNPGDVRNLNPLDPLVQVPTPDFFFDPDELFSSLTFSP